MVVFVVSAITMTLGNKHRLTFWIIILIICIVVINGITITKWIKTNRSTEDVLNKNDYFFGNPIKIIFHYKGKTAEIYPDAEVFHEILVVNEKRTDYTEYFTEISTVVVEDEEGLYMEYCYDTPFRFVVPLQYGNEMIETTRICFSLSGADGSCLSVDTAEGTIVLGQLNPNLELIELARNFFK